MGTLQKIVGMLPGMSKVEDKIDNTTAGMTRFMQELREFVSAASQNSAAEKINIKMDNDPAYSLD